MNPEPQDQTQPKHLYIGTSDGHFTVYSPHLQNPSYTATDLWAKPQHIIALSLSPDSLSLQIGTVDGNLVQLCTKTHQPIKHFPKIHKDCITSICITSNSEFCYTGSWDNSISKISLVNKEILIETQPFFNDGICSMAITKDDKWLFLGSDMPGHVKQIDVEGGKAECVKDYGNLHHDGINAMCVSFDGRFLFTTSYDGVLKQIDVEGQSVVKDFGQVHYSGIESIVICRKDENLWTSDSLGNVCHISLKADSRFRRTEFPGVHGSCIYAQSLDDASGNLYVSSHTGSLKVISSELLEISKDLGRVTLKGITAMQSS